MLSSGIDWLVYFAKKFRNGLLFNLHTVITDETKVKHKSTKKLELDGILVKINCCFENVLLIADTCTTIIKNLSNNYVYITPVYSYN